MYLKTEYSFDAAHNLVAYHGRCERLHGHTYRMALTLRGEPDSEGMIMDFLEIKKTVREKVLDILDHSYLNDLISQPTAENICIWVWDRLSGAFPKEGKGPFLYEIQIWETAGNSAILREEFPDEGCPERA
ncbi:MAG: 6-carboxytetrahydropterin synthase QueD [Thermovirgaceae bacterium]|nr:6-carboxytetrahydropterin synthase QueD [Thermovirgaceae bacterium]